MFLIKLLYFRVHSARHQPQTQPRAQQPHQRQTNRRRLTSFGASKTSKMSSKMFEVSWKNLTWKRLHVTFNWLMAWELGPQLKWKLCLDFCTNNLAN